MPEKVVTLTPEDKKRLMKLSHEVIDLLVEKTNNPYEALILLKKVKDALEETLGITNVDIEGQSIDTPKPENSFPAGGTGQA